MTTSYVLESLSTKTRLIKKRGGGRGDNELFAYNHSAGSKVPMWETGAGASTVGVKDDQEKDEG